MSKNNERLFRAVRNIEDEIGAKKLFDFHIESLQAQNSKLLARVTAITQDRDGYEDRVIDLKALNTRYKGALENIIRHNNVISKGQKIGRGSIMTTTRIAQEALTDTSGEDIEIKRVACKSVGDNDGFFEVIIGKENRNDMVLVPRADIERIELARLKLHELFPNMDITLYSNMQPIFDSMWHLAHRKYPEIKAAEHKERG